MSAAGGASSCHHHPMDSDCGHGPGQARGQARGQAPAADSPPRPLLVFDGDCGFCRTWVARWHRLARGRVDVAPSQEVAHRFPHVPTEQYDLSVVLVEPDGTSTFAAEALLRTLALGGTTSPSWCYRYVPGASFLLERAYRFVAHRRGLFSRLPGAGSKR